LNETEAAVSITSTHLNTEQVLGLLDTEFIGKADRFVFLPIVDSTNTLAMKLARQGSEEGVVVLTDSQKAGKGRQGRRWVDMVGCNVLVSTLLRPLFPPHLLVMVASLAVVDTIATLSGIAATIKWPNDVLIGERKVAGILIETCHDLSGRLVTVVGIGVNVNGHISNYADQACDSSLPVQGLSEKATTLAQECGHELSREAFIAHLLLQIERSYLALQQEANIMLTTNTTPSLSISRLIREKWSDRLSTLGRAIQVRQGDTLLSGVAEGVNENGELLLRCHSGERISITWGDIG
jgi:BirA family transcriptional regulator, biotin operon repressor / biotin---[acetyl-CoA-carboxylase] ligase